MTRRQTRQEAAPGTTPTAATGRPGAATVRYYGQTDPGPVRRSNEDDYLIAELAQVVTVAQAKIPDDEITRGADLAYLFMVADGMGGNAGGSLASVQAVAEVRTFLAGLLSRVVRAAGNPEETVLDELRRAVERADAHLHATAEDVPELEGMGCTLTLALCIGPRAYVAHVGDSRCYLLRDARLERLTTDHTAAAELVRQGKLTPAEASRHRSRHVITNAVGGHRPGVEVELRCADVRPGDDLLLCSDGLTGALTEEEIAATLAADRDPGPRAIV